MKKVFVCALCCVLLLTACSTGKYQRISFGSNSMGEKFTQSVNDETVIKSEVNVDFPSQFSVYEIKEHNISQQECLQILEAIGLPEPATSSSIDGNRVSYMWGPEVATRKPITQTDEQIVEEAKAIFAKIPLTDGEYECIGIRNRVTRYGADEKGEDVRVGVQFCRVIDGFRVTPAEYLLYFDADGFTGFTANLFDYKKTGTMDMVPVEEANERLTTPDDFSIEDFRGSLKGVSELQIENIYIRLVNQHSSGCTILQPIYYYKGKMVSNGGQENIFSAKIIAIPESYTYEKAEEK